MTYLLQRQPKTNDRTSMITEEKHSIEICLVDPQCEVSQKEWFNKMVFSAAHNAIVDYNFLHFVQRK